jgi:transcriptional regulator with XRE-family HTH domain
LVVEIDYQCQKRKSMTTKRAVYPLGEMLRQARKEQNLTLEKLFRMSRVPPSTIWKYENEVVDYSFLTILRLATALGKSLSYFLGKGDRSREDLLASGPEDGISCHVPGERWKLDLYNRRLVGRWLVNGVLHLYSGAELQPRKAAGEELFLRCLKGTIDIALDDCHHSLTQGQSMQFKTSEQVSIHNRGDQDAMAMLAATRFPFVI